MRIVVVSDTHMPRMAKSLPPRLARELANHTDLILHAGDWTGEEVYEQLVRYAPVEGVAATTTESRLPSVSGFGRRLYAETCGSDLYTVTDLTSN